MTQQFTWCKFGRRKLIIKPLGLQKELQQRQRNQMSLKAIATTATSTPPARDLFLHLLRRASSLSQLSQIHAQLICHHLLQAPLIATATKLVHRLFDFQATRHARSLFFSLPEPDLFLFNVLLQGFSDNGKPFSAISLFNKIRNGSAGGLQPDYYTYAFVISAASSLGHEKVGLPLFGKAIVDGLAEDLFVGAALVDLCFKILREEYAVKLFERLPERDTVLCNTMISGLMKSSRFEDSIGVFRAMASGNGPKFDSTTVIAVLPAVAELQDMILGMEIQSLAIKFGYHSHISLLTGLISLYSKCGDAETAWSVFCEIGRRDLISCNAMISGFTVNGQIASSVRLFKELISSGVKIGPSTILGLIPVHSPFGDISLSNCIHGFCVKSGFVSKPPIATALTTVYSRSNEMESAQKLFDESPEKTLASWNAIISGYTQNGCTESAISLFQMMQKHDMNPNSITVTSILSACAQIGALSLGKWIHSIVNSKSFESNIYVSTALIDMYAKCGSIEEARRLFDLTPRKNEVTWNAMISGYGLHGDGQEALKLFYEMLRSSIVPTRVTFLSALNACSHAGLVQEGDEIFHSMVHDYGLEPLAEHYACMVDILGRAGKLEKAMEFIKGMPIDPGPPVWASLLGACMIHKDTKLAHVASKRLLELDEENMGCYVSMSNIHSANRNYAKAALIRKMAKKKNLAKTPGCTLVEIGQIPHVFVSGDQSHPQSAEIYAELGILMGKMKEAGYHTETEAALHDVEEEEKELMTKVHSEKLAIAFGLISTESGTEIRIIKNLRVCLDCHTATKFISKITNRVIVVRDANRFHHFKDGECSCGDYW